MEYVKREPMKSTSGREPTAFTMKTIKELLAEEQAAPAPGDAVTQRTPLPNPQVQQPPHMRSKPILPAKAKPVAKATLKASSAPRIDPDVTAPPTALPKAAVAAQPVDAGEPVAEKRTLLGRLIGR